MGRESNSATLRLTPRGCCFGLEDGPECASFLCPSRDVATARACRGLTIRPTWPDIFRRPTISNHALSCRCVGRTYRQLEVLGRALTTTLNPAVLMTRLGPCALMVDPSLPRVELQRFCRGPIILLLLRRFPCPSAERQRRLSSLRGPCLRHRISFGGRTGFANREVVGSFSEDLFVRHASNAGVCFPAEFLHSENLSPWEIRSHKLQVTFVSLEVTSARLLRPG